MLLFFHDIGFPAWGVALFLIGLLVSPVLFFIGARYLIRGDIRRWTIAWSGIIVFLLGVGFVWLTEASTDDRRFLTDLIMPFGMPAALPLSMSGAPTVVTFLFGLAFQSVSVIGLVRFIEKRVYDTQ